MRRREVGETESQGFLLAESFALHQRQRMAIQCFKSWSQESIPRQRVRLAFDIWHFHILTFRYVIFWLLKKYVNFYCVKTLHFLIIYDTIVFGIWKILAQRPAFFEEMIFWVRFSSMAFEAPQLIHEAEIYKRLQGSQAGIPKIFWTGAEGYSAWPERSNLMKNPNARIAALGFQYSRIYTWTRFV